MRRSYLKLMKYFFISRPQSPMQLIHFITSKCNAKCGHCFYWKNLNTKGELSLEEIDKLSKHLPDLLILNISGGEPFIRGDFAEVIKTYYKNTLVKEVTVPTNGTFTEKTIHDCTDILKNCPDLDLNIVLSLDGIEKIHDDIRQVKDCFKRGVITFRALKELQKSYSHLQVSVVSTLTALNQDTLEEFHSYVKKELKPDVFSLNLIRGEAKNMDLFGVNLQRYKLFYDLEKKSSKKGLKTSLRDLMNKMRMNIIVRNVEKKEHVLPCQAGKIMGVMYEKGDVYPCELLNEKKIGNVRDFDYNFIKLWTSAKNKDTQKFISNTKCYCTHECFLRFNIMYKPTYTLGYFLKSLLGKGNLTLEIDKKDYGKELKKIGEIRGVRKQQDKMPENLSEKQLEKSIERFSNPNSPYGVSDINSKLEGGSLSVQDKV